MPKSESLSLSFTIILLFQTVTSVLYNWMEASQKHFLNKQVLSSSWDARPQQSSAKNWGCAPFGRGSWVPIQHNAAWAETYLCTKCHLDPSSHLPTTDMDRNLGAVHLGGVELGLHLTQCCPGRGLTSYQVAFWSIQPFGHKKHGPKIGGCAPFWGGRAGSPSSTMWPDPRPTTIPSGILTHAAIWPQ